MGHLTRTIALVGMMGAGKSSIGRRLASRLHVVFRDADSEIEAAARSSIAEIFERYGEAAFRDCERKVICRLLGEPPHVLATGGGALMDADTRARIKELTVSVWIKAPVDVLLARVKRKNDRPLLNSGDPRQTLERLLLAREPIYAQSDLTIESADGPHGEVVERLVEAMTERGVWVQA